MRILSRALALGALLAAAPLAGASAVGAASTQPYHQASAAGHSPLQLAGRSRDDDRRHRPRWTPTRPWSSPWNFPGAGPGRGWSQPHWHGGGPAYLAPRALPGWAVEHRLRQQSFRPVGQIVWRHGVYLVPALDPRGRRVLLTVDPASGAILGRQRRR